MIISGMIHNKKNKKMESIHKEHKDTELLDEAHLEILDELV